MVFSLLDDLAAMGSARRYANLVDVPGDVSVVQIGKTYYPKERVDRLYSKLTTPPLVADIYNAPYYSGERVRGYIDRTRSLGEPATASVSFKAHYPETGWDYASPQEMGIVTASPRPMREMAQMARGFQNLLESKQGRGLFINQPISEHRGKAYEKMGFQQVTPGLGTPMQFLDNRRFQNSKALAEVYLQGDMRHLDKPLAEAAARNLLNKHLDSQDLQDTYEMLQARRREYKNRINSGHSSTVYNLDPDDDIDF